VWESGFIVWAAFCARVAGIGGGNGIFIGEILSVSFNTGKWIDEFEDEDDDEEGTFVFVFILIAVVVDGSSSIEFDATARSRSFRTSRTVRWNNCWTYS
jgi:hypothetical protein